MTTNTRGAMPGKVTPKEKAAGGKTTTATTLVSTTECNSTGSDLTLATTTTETRVDSRLLAGHLGNKHQNLFELLKKHRADFEELGILRFQKGVIDGRGQPEKFAMLNEDQSMLALTYSRNSDRVRSLKVRLVKAFSEARRAKGIRQTEYLPEYHRLHNKIRDLADGSTSERFVHINVNKALNKFAGLAAGQRGSAPTQNQSLLNVGQMIAARAMQGAQDHHDGYAKFTQALQKMTGMLAIEVAQ